MDFAELRRAISPRRRVMRFLDLDWDRPAPAVVETVVAPPATAATPAEDIVPEGMTPAEIECLQKHLAVSRNYLEFGSGGSTVMAVDAGVERIQSVESDPVWIEKLSNHPRVADAVQQGRVLMHHADIGPISEHGRPASEGSRAFWPNYYSTIWQKVRSDAIDLYLIDGRFRVRTMVEVLRRCRPDATILYHDFWTRPGHHVVLNHVEWVASAGNFAVFHPRPAHPSLDDLAKRYAYTVS